MPTLDEARRWLDASGWLGVGIIGALVFLAGIYQPAWRHVPDAAYLEVALAIVGGATATLGLSFWWDQREDERTHPKRAPLKGRAREIATIAPSLEIYRPGPVERPARDGETRDDDLANDATD